MKSLRTLAWLELRATFLWSLILLASVALWHFVFRLAPTFQMDTPDENVAVLAVFVVGANVVGLLTNLVYLVRAWQSMRNGELQFKLSSATQPALIVSAQFLVALLSIALYSFAVTTLGWWHLNQMGLAFSLMSAWALWLYGQVAFFAPAIALGFLVTSYSAAFHLRSIAWLAVIFGVIGFSRFIELAFSIVDTFGYSLLSIPLPSFTLFGEPFIPDMGDARPAALPQEIIWIALIITVLSLYFSGRVLREVEL